MTTPLLLERPDIPHWTCHRDAWVWRPANNWGPGEWICGSCHPLPGTTIDRIIGHYVTEVISIRPRGRPKLAVDLPLARQLRQSHGWLTLAREYNRITGQNVSKQTLMRLLQE